MMQIRHLLLATLAVAPMLSAAESTVTTMVGGAPTASSLTHISFDGDNVTLTFADLSTLTADMASVSVVLDHTNTALDAIVADPSLPTGIYDLSGRRIADRQEGLQPGVYIVNGKKILVK